MDCKLLLPARRFLITEGMQGAKDGLHINQNPYCTKNWSDCDLRELSRREMLRLYTACTYWKKGYKSVKK